MQTDFERQSQLWQTIQLIPDEVLTEYLADNIIDEQEIEDITLRLERHMKDLTITPSDHAQIRAMVRQAVAHLQAEEAALEEGIESKLNPTTLADIRNVMSNLVQSGHIKLAVSDACITDDFAPNEAIPDERPDDYDETEENPV
jgi:hypothetical protein